MSQDAKTFLYWADAWRAAGGSDGQSDRAHCHACARAWAAHLIAQGC